MIVPLNFERTLDSLRPFRMRLISPAIGSFTLRFRFNARAWADPQRRASPDEGAWMFRLDDITGTPLIRTRRVTASPNLLAVHQADPRVPPGVLRCVGGRDPWARDLGEGMCSLVYEE